MLWAAWLALGGLAEAGNTPASGSSRAGWEEKAGGLRFGRAWVTAELVERNRGGRRLVTAEFVISRRVAMLRAAWLAQIGGGQYNCKPSGSCRAGW